MNSIQEQVREAPIPGPWNPQRCAICDGQDGVLDRDGEDYVHPYCKRVCEVMNEGTKDERAES